MTAAEIEEKVRLARGQKLPAGKLVARVAIVAVPFVVVFVALAAFSAPTLVASLTKLLGSGIAALLALAFAGVVFLLAIAWLIFPLIVWWQLDQILKALRSKD